MTQNFWRGVVLILASAITGGCIGGYALNLDSTPRAGIVAVGQACPSCPLLTQQAADSNGLWAYDAYSGEPSAAPPDGQETAHFLICDFTTTFLCYDVYHRPQWQKFASDPDRYASLVATTYFPESGQTGDSDGDMLPDAVETQVLHTDPNNKDTDGDGIGDGAEVLGWDWVDYGSFGANPLHKDVFFEVDYEEYTDDSGVLHTWKPSSAVVDKITAFYAALNVANPDGTSGIAVHLVFDTVLAQGSAPCNSTWREGQAPFNEKHQKGFHYVYFASASGFGGQTNTPDTSGVSHPPARSFVCGPEADHDASNDQTELAQFYAYANFLHEAGGHGLGMNHGGGDPSTGLGDNVNCKPNYPSLMNYAYEYNFNNDLNTLQGTKLQFSNGSMPQLTETSLQEQNSFPGVAPADLAFLSSGVMAWPTQTSDGNLWVDWNRDGTFSSGTISPVAIRRNPPCNTATPISRPLSDHDDAAFIASALAKTILGAGN